MLTQDGAISDTSLRVLWQAVLALLASIVMVQIESGYMLTRLAKAFRRIESRDPSAYKAVMRIGPSNVNGVQIALYK